MWQLKNPDSCPYYGEDRHGLRTLMASKDRDEEHALWEFIKRTHDFLYDSSSLENKLLPLKKPTFPLTPLEVFQKTPALQRRKLLFKSLERGDIFYLKVIREEFDCYKLLAIDKYKGCFKIDDLSIMMELPKLPQELKHLYPSSFSVIRAALSSCNVKERALCVTFDQSVVKEEFRNVPLGPIYDAFSPHYLGNPFLGISLTDNMFMTGDIRLGKRLSELPVIGIDENKVYSHMKKINRRKLLPLLTRSAVWERFTRATSNYYYKLALASMDKGRIKQALSHLKMALKLWNEYPEALLLAGKCYNVIGDTPNAFVCTMKVYKTYPNVSAARKQMCMMLVDAAKVHLSYNNKTLARESLEMARIIDPENENAKKLLISADLLIKNPSLMKPNEKYGIPNPFENEEEIIVVDDDDRNAKPKRKHHKKKASKTKHERSKLQRHHRSSKPSTSQEVPIDHSSSSHCVLRSKSSNSQSKIRQHSNKSPNRPSSLASSNETRKSFIAMVEKTSLEIEVQKQLNASTPIPSGISMPSEDSPMLSSLFTKTFLSSIQDLSMQSGNPSQPIPLDTNPPSQYSLENLSEKLTGISQNICTNSNQTFQQANFQQYLAMILQSHFSGTPNLAPQRNELPMHSDIQWKVPAIPFLEPSILTSGHSGNIPFVENQTIPTPIHSVTAFSANQTSESKQSTDISYPLDSSQGQVQTNCLQNTCYQTVCNQPESSEDKKTSDEKSSQSTPVHLQNTTPSNSLFQNPLPTNLKTKYFKPISPRANQSLSSGSSVVQTDNNTSKNTQNVHNAELPSSSNANQVAVNTDPGKSPERSPKRRTPKRYRTPPPKKSGTNSSTTRYRKSSPKRRKSRSPNRHRNRSPRKNRSRSPRKNRSRSPRKNRSRSPGRFPSSFKKTSLSPKRSESRSPRRFKSFSPKRSRSHSPISRGRPVKRSRSRSRIRSRSRSANRSGIRSRIRSRSRSANRSGIRSRIRSRSRARRHRSRSRKRSRSISSRGYRGNQSYSKESKYKTSYQNSFASVLLPHRDIHSQGYPYPCTIKQEQGFPLSYEISNPNISDVVVSSPSFSSSSCDIDPNSPSCAELFKHSSSESHLVRAPPDILKEDIAQFGRSQSPPWQRHVSIVTKPEKHLEYSSSPSSVFSSRQKFVRKPSPERAIPVICTRVVSYK